MTFARGTAEPVFDVALASFAVHHLTSSDEKRRFITAVRRHLRSGATLYIVDVFCRDGVSTTPEIQSKCIQRPEPCNPIVSSAALDPHTETPCAALHRRSGRGSWRASSRSAETRGRA